MLELCVGSQLLLLDNNSDAAQHQRWYLRWDDFYFLRPLNCYIPHLTEKLSTKKKKKVSSRIIEVRTSCSWKTLHPLFFVCYCRLNRFSGPLIVVDRQMFRSCQINIVRIHLWVSDTWMRKSKEYWFKNRQQNKITEGDDFGGEATWIPIISVKVSDTQLPKNNILERILQVPVFQTPPTWNL